MLDLDGIDSIGVRGRIQLVVRIGVNDDSNGPGPGAVAIPDGVVAEVSNGVLRCSDARDADADTSGEIPTLSVSVPALRRVGAASQASVTLIGTQEHLEIEALNYGSIDGTRLTLNTAAIELELSEVAVHATGAITGYCAYLSELTVSGGADTSGVTATNGGRIATIAPE